MPGCLGPHAALCPGDNIKQVRILLPSYAVHPKKQLLQVRLPEGLGGEGEQDGEGQVGVCAQPAKPEALVELGKPQVLMSASPQAFWGDQGP